MGDWCVPRGGWRAAVHAVKNVVKGDRLHEQVAALLARDIAAGRLPATGVVPSEPELVETYGVSKTVAREAVQALAAANMVTVRHGKRTVIRPEQEWHHLSRLVWEALCAEGRASLLVSELYEVRLLLEPAVARTAAESASTAQIQGVQQALAGMEAAMPVGEREFLELDRAFHIAVARGAAANGILGALMRDVHEVLSTSWAWSDLTGDDVMTALGHHRAIAGAIEVRDAQKAEAAMRRHIEWASATDRRAGPTQEQSG